MPAGMPGAGGRGPIIAPPPLAVFPLSAMTNGRGLQTPSAAPFWMLGDSAQTVIARLSTSQIASYLDTRVSQGFNAVMIELFSHQTSVANCPANFNGDQPFTTKATGGTYVGTSGTADFSTPNNNYFNYVDAVLDLIASRNMLCLAYPLAWGFNLDGTEGWWPDMMLTGNSRSVHGGLGTYLGNRYGSRKNITWLRGSDSQGNTSGTPESGIAREAAMTSAMRAAGALQLYAGDWAAPSESTDAPSDATAGVALSDYISLQGTYSYGSTFPNGSPIRLRLSPKRVGAGNLRRPKRRRGRLVLSHRHCRAFSKRQPTRTAHLHRAQTLTCETPSSGPCLAVAPPACSMVSTTASRTMGFGTSLPIGRRTSSIRAR